MRWESVWLVGDCMGWFPGPGHSMRTRPVSWMKAALISTLMLKWKIRGSRHIWKTSLSGPMRENGGCVTSHLLQCIKGDVKSHFPDFPPAHTHTLRTSYWQRHKLLLTLLIQTAIIGPHVIAHAHKSHLGFK